MTKRHKRMGAFMLALAMSVSLVLGSVPALAAGTEGEISNKPKLVMDFLGDNKTSYYDRTANSGGGLGDGTLHEPEDSDQAWKSTADDGTKWNGYVQADAAASAAVGGTQTIFWIGIGIQDVDKFVLSKDGNGLYSAEVALYYNPYYVSPYDAGNGNEGFKDSVESYMMGSNGKRNQWPDPGYRVVSALTDQEPLNDPNDPVAQGDFTAAQYGVTGGYGTEEFAPPGTWKMAYVSVEMTEEELTGPAWLSGSHTESDTYYIAMVPFVLHHYDPDNKLCIRLARNASAFSIGAKISNGTGRYGDGAVSYGNWDKYTYHDPEHDLKLMLDYTGDLNIFTNERETDYHEATLLIRNGGNADNKAQMMFNNDPLDPPSQLADASGEQIIHLTGGEELRVSAKKMTGFTVTVSVAKDDDTGITPVSITAVDDWTDEWVFLMPDGADVTVTVTFEGRITPDTKFKVDLEVIDNNYNESGNTAKLTAPGGLTTQAIATGSDTLSGGGATAGTMITVSVTRNSDYNVEVTLVPATGSAPPLSLIIDQSEAQTYTFIMPPSDMKVQVEFKLKEPHKATLAVQGTVASSVAAFNYAKMGYTNGQNVSYFTENVSFADAQNSPSSVPGLDKNQIQSASGRTIYIDTVCSPEYQVSNIIFRKGDDTLDPSITATLTSTPGRYAYTMPDYEIKVIVVYELVQTYRVRLILDTGSAQSGEGATLTGADARGTLDLSLSKEQYEAFVAAGTLEENNLLEMFPNANIGVSFFHMEGGGKVAGLGTGRTASIEVWYPDYPATADSDIIIPTGSAGSGYSFSMRQLEHPSTDAAHTDAVYVVVKFEDATGEDLIARIYNDRTGVPAAATANTVWAGITPASNAPITVHENDQISVKIDVGAGVYIASVQVYTEGPADTYEGVPMGIPVSLSGIGYNNGQGGTETASFTMPGQNATIVVKYGVGTPPKEPGFTATIRKAGEGSGTINIENKTTNAVPYSAPNGSAKWVDAATADQITATYAPDGNSYVSGVTVSANVPGTAVSWQYEADGSVSVTMPAADVVITVTFASRTDKEPSQLTIKKIEPLLNANNIVTVSPSGGQAQVSTADTAVTNAYEDELIQAEITVDAGWHIVSATAKLDADGTTIPVTLSGNGYNNSQGGAETAVFQMPADSTTLSVKFEQGEPDNTITLVVTEPAGAGNSATLYLNGMVQGQPAVADAPAGPFNADPGTPVRVQVAAQPGYAVDLPILTTPNGVVSVTWTAVDIFEFVMPEEPLTVTVPFLLESDADSEFYADLIFRDGDGQSAGGVAAARGTFLNLSSLTNANYADQLEGTLRYSRAARPGEEVPFAVRIPDGYYISDITVTPADFGVESTLTGMIGTQRGEFLMPAGNVRVNVYLSKGWPDETRYHVTLHAEGPDDQSTATLQSVTTPGSPVGPLPAGGQSSGSGSLTALDGEKMRVTLNIAPGHDLESVTVVDGGETPVSCQWAADGEDLAVEFNVPGSSVDVYVKYTDELDKDDHKVTLHLDDGGTGASVTMTKNSGPADPPFNARGGDQIGLTVSSPAPADALIAYAYAVTEDGAMVSLGDPALAGAFASEVENVPHGFVMPFHTDVDVYIGFTSAAKTDENQYSLTLQVNGDNDSGSVTVREYDSNNAQQGSMSVNTASGSPRGAAMLAHGGNKITAEVVPAGNYALYSLIAYTSDGERVVVSLDTTDNYWRTYTFTMPQNTTHIEAEFRRVEANTYQIQVVVNNEVNNGAGNNDAFLYQPPGALTDGFKFKSGVSAGDTFDLGFIVDTGYQVATILAVPQGSGVAANIPLPATSSGRTQVKMPASNLVIYVIFSIDNTTRYDVIGTIGYVDGVEPPADPESNDLKLEGEGSGQTDTLESNDQTASGSFAMIQEAQGQRVDVTWTPAPDYIVAGYTVKTSSGEVVLSEPNADNNGCFFYMPAAPVEVNVIFTKGDVEPPSAYNYTATLHYVQAGTGDRASIQKDGDMSTIVDTDNGVISGLHVGDQIDISATPGSNRYIQAVYVLQSGPDMAQNGQELPLQNSNITGASATGDFFMPSGNVDVYVVFTAAQPRPNTYMATVKVNAGGADSNTTNFAVISTSLANQATAYCDGAPASIVAEAQATVTIRVTVDANHEIASVTGTPITPAMQPQVAPGATGAGGVTVYTFTMPANNASVIVDLREKQAAKYKLYLHVLNQGDGSSEDDNVTILEYGNPVLGSLIRGQESDPPTPGAAPTGSDPVIPFLETPSGSPVTLTVKPGQGYYVKAAYVVYENGLVAMVPAPLADDYARDRVATGLEGTTALDVGVLGLGGKPVNTAEFTMPQGNADVYVVYEKGTVPDTPWYNVVVIATDSGGTPGNAGHGQVKVSSTAAVTGGAAAIDSVETVPSTGAATFFYGVPYGERIHLDATEANDNYQYDASTGMILTYQTAGATASPAIGPEDTANYPRGDKQMFGMPRSNVGVRVNFTKTGTTDLWAQLHVVQADGVPGYSANRVTLSTGAAEDNNYQYVDNHELTAAGPTGGASPNPDTTGNMILRDLTSQQLISTLIHPRDNGTRVVQVVVTQVDKDGNVLSTTLATHAGDPTNSGQDWYNYIMGDNNVHVYVVLAKRTDTNRFVAVATPVYGDSGISVENNKITGLTNTTTDGLSSAPYWTEVKAEDRVKVTYTAEAGVYVDVKAYRAGTANELPALAFGVGNGSDGYAYVDIPDPGCDVEIQVIFSRTPPEAKNLTFISRGHGGKPNNVTELQKEDPDSSGSYIALSGVLTPTDGVLTDLVWPSGSTHTETPGTKLKVQVNSLEEGYEVQKVEVKAGSFTVEYYLSDPDDTGDPSRWILTDASGQQVDPLMMPNGDAEIIVYFKVKDDGLIPYDPNNTDSDKDYVDYWIKAENRGDYLIVTVPQLKNGDDSSFASVTWTDEKQDRFKFYIMEDAATPVYTSVDHILKINRPADAPAPVNGEPYWIDNFLGAPNPYLGARFIVEIMTDKEIEDDNDITNTADAKALAAILRKIMDNDGTPNHDDKYSLYISCEETTYQNGAEDNVTEGDKVDFEVPRYYALTGKLESYAPAHIATFTLTDEAASGIFFTSTLEGINGVDLWRQDFKLKLTSDFEGKLENKSFTLTVEKAGHVTYTRTAITLDTSAVDGTYNAGELTFAIQDAIRLFGGDVDGNSFVEQRDVQLLIAVTNGVFPVTRVQSEDEAGWKNSVYNPKSVAYAADLNGDREIDVRDMNIVLDEANYGRGASNYGAPTGLSGMAGAALLSLQMPQWYTDMLLAGMAVPEWAEAVIQAQGEIPDWMGELLKADVDIPAWAIELVMTDVAIPDWTGRLIEAGTVVPEWMKDLAAEERTVPVWAVELVEEGVEIPAWAVEFVTTDVVIPDWAVEQIAAGQAVPAWAVELIVNGEELPEEILARLAAGESLPETRPEETPAAVETLPPVAAELPAGGEAQTPEREQTAAGEAAESQAPTPSEAADVPPQEEDAPSEEANPAAGEPGVEDTFGQDALAGGPQDAGKNEAAAENAEVGAPDGEEEKDKERETDPAEKPAEDSGEVDGEPENAAAGGAEGTESETAPEENKEHSEENEGSKEENASGAAEEDKRTAAAEDAPAFEGKEADPGQESVGAGDVEMAPGDQPSGEEERAGESAGAELESVEEQTDGTAAEIEVNTALETAETESGCFEWTE